MRDEDYLSPCNKVLHRHGGGALCYGWETRHSLGSVKRGSIYLGD